MPAKDYICFFCGKLITYEEAKGSAKAPVCKKCWKERFNKNTYYRFLLWVEDNDL